MEDDKIQVAMSSETDSSSEDEDWSKFQSVVQSGDQIVGQSLAIAEKVR